MRAFGWFLFVIGAITITGGWTISSGYGGVVNIESIYIKISLALVGGFLLVTGSIFANAPQSNIVDIDNAPNDGPIDLSRYRPPGAVTKATSSETGQSTPAVRVE